MIIPTFDLTISIVLFKTPRCDLRMVLDSLILYKGKFFLFIIDNSPTDELRSECPTNISYDYIHLPSNPGYGTAHNVAIRKSLKLKSPYHLVLNADIHFSSDIISPMISYLNGNKKIGLMMPKILNCDGSLQHLCKLVPTPLDLLARRFYTNKLKFENNQRFELHSSGYDKLMFVPYLSGCFMLLRNSALREIGLFDERFFMYPEDIDLTRRMAERYETIFFPEVSVIHKHGAASQKSFKMLFIHILNIIKYFNKWGWFIDPIRVNLNKKTLSQFDI